MYCIKYISKRYLKCHQQLHVSVFPFSHLQVVNFRIFCYTNDIVFKYEILYLNIRYIFYTIKGYVSLSIPYIFKYWTTQWGCLTWKLYANVLLTSNRLHDLHIKSVTVLKSMSKWFWVNDMSLNLHITKVMKVDLNYLQN